MKGVKSKLPSKCVWLQSTFACGGKWEKCVDEVKYCSDKWQRTNKMSKTVRLILGDQLNSNIHGSKL
jgi:hypothetical protein